MCQFLSALVLRNGDVLTHPLLDSHSDLVRYYQVPDDRTHHQHFAKVERTPGDTDESWLDPATWRFRLDEETAPGWWEDVKGAAEATLRDRAKAMIVTTGRKDLILEGCWILAGDAEFADVRGGRIVRMLGGTLTEMWGGTLTAMWGGTLTAMCGGTLTAMCGGTLTAMRGGTLTEMCGGTLTAMCGGTLTAMRGGTLTPKPSAFYTLTLSKQAQEFLKALEPKKSVRKKKATRKAHP